MGMCPLLVSCPKKEGKPGDGLFNNVSLIKYVGRGRGWLAVGGREISGTSGTLSTAS